MMNTDDAGVTPDSVMKTLPRMPIERLRSCSYRAASGAPAAAAAEPCSILWVSSIRRTFSQVARSPALADAAKVLFDSYAVVYNGTDAPCQPPVALVLDSRRTRRGL